MKRPRETTAKAIGEATGGQRPPPVTPDGRYFVVRGRLWRCSRPDLPALEREQLVRELMRARRANGIAMRAGDVAAREAARAAVDRAKVALGERGPVWWTDGAPDWNRHMAVNSPYADWYAGFCEVEQSRASCQRRLTRCWRSLTPVSGT